MHVHVGADILGWQLCKISNKNRDKTKANTVRLSPLVKSEQSQKCLETKICFVYNIENIW